MNTDLSPETIIQLSDCHVSVEDDCVNLSGPSGKTLRCRQDVLRLLEFFSVPRTLSEAARQPAMAHDWVRCMRTVLSLVDAGILRTLSATARVQLPGLDNKGFGGAVEHIAMLNDRDRTGKYISAIRSTVKPGDTVIDLGCGTGILAAVAAMQGAAQVHAIERSGIAEAAERFFSRNGLGEQVRIHRTPSRDVNLDERGDLLVTELVGNEPLSERILEYVIDAKARLLKPGALVLPASLSIYAQCFSIDPAVVDRYQFSADSTRNWSGWYGLDFTSFADLRTHLPLSVDLLPGNLMQSLPCSEPCLVSTIELAAVESPHVRCEVSIPVTVPAEINAVYVSFDIRLAADIHISHLFRDLTADSSWNCRVWLPRHPIVAGPGDTVDIVYRHDPLGTRLEFPKNIS